MSYLVDFWSPWPAPYFQDLVKPYLTPGALVMVPFANVVEPLIQLYQADGKVIVANIDQLPLLWAKANCTPIDRVTLTRAFIQLGDTLKNEQPLRERINQLYQTTCPACQAEVVACYFVWNRTLADPQQKYVVCPACSFDGLSPVTKVDLLQLDHVETRGVHYHFLLGRVIGPTLASDDRLRLNLERWHELYTPRNLYAVAELIMKIDATIVDQALQSIFKAILLTCLLPASNLYGQKSSNALPKRLTIPIQSVEHNVWQLFETAVMAWPLSAQPVRLAQRITDLLEMRQNSLYLFPDSPNRLKRYVPDEAISLVISAPPLVRANHWALTTLWGGWLLGLKAAEATYQFLRRRSADWGAYQTQIFQTLFMLKPTLKPDTPWHFVFLPEHRLQPLAIVVAALKADYEIDLWEITPASQTITLFVNTGDRPLVRDLDLMANQVQHEIKDVVTSVLDPEVDGDAIIVDDLCWLGWQSVLYSGLLAQVVASVSEKQVIPWLEQQTQAVLKTVLVDIL